jgi:hypothetical protein
MSNHAFETFVTYLIAKVGNYSFIMCLFQTDSLQQEDANHTSEEVCEIMQLKLI